jgi:type I restriction enzyme S subunit
MSEKKLKEQPEGWEVTKLNIISSDVSYGYTASSTLEKIGPHLLRITDIQKNQVNWSSVPFCQIEKSKFPQYKVEKGDLLFARTGATVGKSYLVNDDVPLSVYASYLIRVRCFAGTNIQFMAHFFNSPNYWNQITEFSSGIGQPNVNGTKLKELKIPLAPIGEQKRIVEKLDSLLAQVDTIQQRLNTLPNIIKRFRQSVLAAAVSGKLTEQWRGDNDCDALVDLKIELVNKDQNQKKIEPTSNHEIVTDQLPDCWGVSTFDLMYRFIDYRGRTPKKSEQGKRLITAKNIKMGFLSDEPVEYLSDDDYTNWMTRGFPQLNDLFFVTEGHTMGCVALNTRTDEFALAQRTITLQPYGSLITKFHYYYILTNAFQRLVETNATGSAAKGIKAAKFRGLPLPFPSYKEQTEIVRLVEQYFALADTLEKHLKNAKQRIDNLTQAILAKAFKGELVPQEPSDEPADKLLARIKAARLEAEALEKATKKAAKTKTPKVSKTKPKTKGIA